LPNTVTSDDDPEPEVPEMDAGFGEAGSGF
jgi:hypothetical protein